MIERVRCGYARLSRDDAAAPGWERVRDPGWIVDGCYPR